jgi:hypothetical protein
MLTSETKPCMFLYEFLTETVDGSLKRYLALSFTRVGGYAWEI